MNREMNTAEQAITSPIFVLLSTASSGRMQPTYMKICASDLKQTLSLAMPAGLVIYWLRFVS